MVVQYNEEEREKTGNDTNTVQTHDGALENQAKLEEKRMNRSLRQNILCRSESILTTFYEYPL